MSDIPPPLPKIVVEKLLQNLEGSVHIDPTTRSLYATDASMYRQYPIGVCHPASRRDVSIALEITADHDTAVLPRGGGTSLAGQTIGKALIMDFSTHMDQILNKSPEEQSVTVQPGVVLNDLNQQLSSDGLIFGPNVATDNRATIGGMIGNNSAGSHSIRYGQTSDHVEWLEVVMPDGSVTRLQPTEQPSLAAERSRDGADRTQGRNDQVLHFLQNVAQDHASDIPDRFPNILRNVAGYRINHFLNNDDPNPAQIIPGSEGTLATVTRAGLNLVSKPQKKVLGIVQFDSLFEALSAVDPILVTEPYAVELVDDLLLDLARNHSRYQKYTSFLKDQPEAILMVEYEGSSLDALQNKLQDLETFALNHLNAHNVSTLTQPEDQNRAWKLRKAGLGIMMSMTGDERTAAFVEDTAVPVQNLESYGRRFHEILQEFDMRASFYGHASVGLLHIRPFINLKSQKDIQKIKPLSTKIFELAKEHGGTYCGEHGEGKARSWFSRQFYGDSVYEAFQKVKRFFDPDNRMNPGTIVDSPDPDKTLRYGQGQKTRMRKTYLNHEEQGGFQRSLELCNGNGLCRKTDSGTMCPSYMVTGRERDSTRARANALREMISGKRSLEDLTSGKMKDVMDLCIGCKACKEECPSKVDMARHKFEYLAYRNQKQGVSWNDYLFGTFGRMARYSPDHPFLRKLLFKNAVSLSESLMKTILDIHPERPLPTPGIRSFQRKLSEDTSFPSRKSLEDTGTSSSNGKPKLFLFIDTFTSQFQPDIGIAAVELFDALGYEVLYEPVPCCGRPAFSKGLFTEFRQSARRCSGKLLDYARKNIPIVFLEPSCHSAVTNDFQHILNQDRIRPILDHSYSWDEFLSEQSSFVLPESDAQGNAPFIHPHCHQDALIGTDYVEQTFKNGMNADVQFSKGGCCGMAGVFGYENDHYQISRKMAERKLLPKIRSLTRDHPVLAPGFSCRHQIKDLTDRTPRHPVQYLAEQLHE